jgi:hypothetical protein
VIFTRALRQLAEEARHLRAQLAPDDPERKFLLGVDAAVQSFLHPEATGARPPGWLAHETEAFGEGYLATVTDVTVAVSSGTAPISLALPQPPAGMLSKNSRISVRDEPKQSQRPSV